MSQQRTTRDEKDLLLKRLALQRLREKRLRLLEGAQADAMVFPAPRFKMQQAEIQS